MKVSEILADMPNLKAIRDAHKRVSSADHTDIVASVSVAIAGRTEVDAVQEVAKTILASYVSGNQFKNALKNALKAKSNAFEAKYAGITIEED